MTHDEKWDGVDIFFLILFGGILILSSFTVGFRNGKETVYDAIKKDPMVFVSAVNSLSKTNKEQEELKKLIREMESGSK